MVVELRPRKRIEPEEFLPIRGWEDYLISNWGRVFSVRSKKLLKARPSEWGYAQVCLSKRGARLWAYIHVLVAQRFVPGEDEGLEVNHIDGDKSYNNEINLEWVTKRENNQHAIDTGLRRPRGVKIHINETGENFDSIKACADHIGMTPNGVRYALRYGTKTRGGFSFEYIDRAQTTSEESN